MFKKDKDNFRDIMQQPAQTHLNNQFSQKVQNTHQNTNHPKNFLAHRPHQTASLVAVPLHALGDTLQIYCWRFQTEYPVIKAYTTGVLLNKTQPIIRLNIDHIINNQHSLPYDHQLYLEVITETVDPLSTFAPLFFGSFTYALKEALIGFERLFALFGAFTIAPQMIVVNSLGRVKVWISTHLNQNTKSQAKASIKDNEQNSQKNIVQQIKQIFQSFSHNNSTYRQFFTYIEGADTFLALLKKLEEFTSNKRILVAHSIKKQPQKLVKRPFSPSSNLHTNKLSHNLFSSPSNKLLFKQRETIGIPLCQQHKMKSLRSMNNLQMIISEMQTKQTLSTKSDLMGQNLMIDHKSNEENTYLACYRSKQQSSRLKKLDSLEKNLQNLFENDDQRTEQQEPNVQSGLRSYGKAIKGSTYFEDSSFCQRP